MQTGELTFYINEKRVTKGNDIISITPTDWKLLMAFIEHPRHILSRNQLLESLWDVNSDYVDENAVAVNIRRLREKSSLIHLILSTLKMYEAWDMCGK